jgi:Fuc2NAc and GlcNAc transferase
MSWTFLLPLIAALIAFACDVLIIRNAPKWRLLDKPNHRSSHFQPTPSGGGIGLALAGALTGLFTAWQANWVLGAMVLAISIVLALVSFLDDLRPMRASLRLGIQAAMGACLLFLLGGLPEIERFLDAYISRSLIYVMLLLVVVWWINLFNFMDGIDGLAGSQAIFMLVAGALLLTWLNPAILGSPLWLWMLCIVGATSGFLVLNWSPAKIFMGDVGSIYLSFMILSLALLSIRNDWIPVLSGLAMWAILGAAFVADATVTLFVRMLTGQRWYEAHRDHAYQRLSRRLGHHKPVTILFLAVNCGWLLPLAMACIFLPQWSAVWLAVAYLPLILAVLLLGGGRPATGQPHSPGNRQG